MPSEFKEIIVELYGNLHYNYHLCYEQLTDATKIYGMGLGSTTSVNASRINVSRTNVSLHTLTAAGNDASTTATVTVYYKD